MNSYNTIIRNIKRFTVNDYLRQEYYIKLYGQLKNKFVLDVGCAEGELNQINKNRLWNHFFIYSVAKRTIGIDIQKGEIDQMSKMGFDVRLMDAEKIKFKEKFDIIFAGELIEHLPNPGLFLLSARKAINNCGKIILSTPNTFSANRLFRVFQFKTNDPPTNPDHTLYLTPTMIGRLALLSGLKVEKIIYSHFPFIHNSILVILNKFVCKVVGENFKEQIIVVLVKDSYHFLE